MKFVLLHGWEGSPELNWFPWLKEELEKLGHEAKVPLLPNSNSPKMDEWLSFLNNFLDEEKEPIVMVGHSLGAVLILRYLEQQRKKPLVKIAILVAGGLENRRLIPELTNFFTKPFDFSKIRSSSEKFVSISGTDDPFTSGEVSKRLANSLGTERIWVENGGHLAEEWGYTKLPILLSTIKKELKI